MATVAEAAAPAEWRATPSVPPVGGPWSRLEAWARRDGGTGAGRALRAFARFGLRVGVGAAAVVRVVVFSFLAFVAVVLPWAFQRALLLDPLSVPRRRQSRWLERGRLDVRPDRRWTVDAALRAPRPLRKVRVPIAVVALLLCSWVVARRTVPEIHAAVTATPAAYAHSPWWREYKLELDYLNAPEVWNPLSWQRVHDIDMRYIDVVHGQRVTWQPPACSCRTVHLWLYGGSAAFGLGQRNLHTIASDLSRLAHADGYRLVVDNFGVPGDSHWEEAIRFNWQLGLEHAPDLVAFYDGQNDLIGASIRNGYHEDADRQPVSLPLAGIRHAEDAPANGLLDTPILKPPGAKLLPVPDSYETNGAKLARRAVADYELGRRLSRQGAKTAGIPAFWFWQPVRMSRKPIPGEPQDPPGNEAAGRTSYEAARAALAPDVIDLASAIQGTKEPLFYDDVHHNEEGARLVAAAMWKRLLPAVREAAR
jgi:hypothetical protein